MFKNLKESSISQEGSETTYFTTFLYYIQIIYTVESRGYKFKE